MFQVFTVLGSATKRLLFVALCAVILAEVWWARHAESNDERAYFAKDGAAIAWR
jgi:hypothetical protein